MSAVFRSKTTHIGTLKTHAHVVRFKWIRRFRKIVSYTSKSFLTAFTFTSCETLTVVHIYNTGARANIIMAKWNLDESDENNQSDRYSNKTIRKYTAIIQSIIIYTRDFYGFSFLQRQPLHTYTMILYIFRGDFLYDSYFHELS